MKQKRGFTIIELIVVVAIIGVLAAILVPAMSGYVKKSQIKADCASAKTIGNQVVSILLDAGENTAAFYQHNTTAFTVSVGGEGNLAEDYVINVVTRTPGKKSSGMSGLWQGGNSEAADFQTEMNTRMNFSSSQINVKLSGSYEKDGYKADRWIVVYRKDSPTTIEVWCANNKQWGCFPVCRLWPNPVTDPADISASAGGGTSGKNQW